MPFGEWRTLGVHHVRSGCELGKLRLQGLDARFECGDYFVRSQSDDRDGMGVCRTSSRSTAPNVFPLLERVRGRQSRLTVKTRMFYAGV
jgi:hypothetical protein